MILQILLQIRENVDSSIRRLSNNKASLNGKEIEIPDDNGNLVKYIVSIDPELTVNLTNNIITMFNYLINPLQRLSIDKLSNRLYSINEILNNQTVVQIVPTILENEQHYEVLVIKPVAEENKPEENKNT